MLPSYLFAIGMHGFNATRLMFNLDSPVYLLDTFLALQIYVWVRVAYYFLHRFNVLQQYQYTISVLLAGMVMLPASGGLGMMNNLCCLAFIAIYNAWYWCVPRLCSHVFPTITGDGDDTPHYNLSTHELPRTGFTLQLPPGHPQVPLTSGGESTCPLAAMRASAMTSSRPAALIAKQSSLSERLIAANEQSPQSSVSKDSSPNSNLEAQCAFSVFQSICECPTVGLTYTDLVRLFAIWGLPRFEVGLCMRELKGSLETPDVISFKEFFEHMEPVWKYAFEVVDSYGTLRLELSPAATRRSQTPFPTRPTTPFSQLVAKSKTVPPRLLGGKDEYQI